MLTQKVSQMKKLGDFLFLSISLRTLNQVHKDLYLLY